MRFHVQRNAGGAGAAGKGESDDRPYLAEELQRINAGEGQQGSVHRKHDRQTQIRSHDEATQFDDVVNVRAGNHFSHQRQNAIGSQFHHQTHQFHHPGLQGVDSDQHALTFWLVVFQQLQRRHTQEGREDYHADD
ncbi:hypothetical protein D3C72_1919400 [compost metagenome]